MARFYNLWYFRYNAVFLFLYSCFYTLSSHCIIINHGREEIRRIVFASKITDDLCEWPDKPFRKEKIIMKMMQRKRYKDWTWRNPYQINLIHFWIVLTSQSKPSSSPSPLTAQLPLTDHSRPFSPPARPSLSEISAGDKAPSTSCCECWGVFSTIYAAQKAHIISVPAC